jgi:LmbE family N-acetylglucosaminyl deacetylase
MNFNKFLVLAPHTDDGEFGCGGTIARLLEDGVEGHYISFSICEESVPEGFPKDILQTELEAATEILGIKQENVHSLRYPVRKFNYQRQEILEDIVKFRKLINPDVVFIPSINDIHQDHKVIAEEGIRAFKNSTILSYELLWNIISFNHTCFIELTEEHLEIKTRAIQAYESQMKRKYSSSEFIKSQAIVRGVQSGCDLAEVFEVVRIFSKL